MRCAWRRIGISRALVAGLLIPASAGAIVRLRTDDADAMPAAVESAEPAPADATGTPSPDAPNDSPASSPGPGADASSVLAPPAESPPRAPWLRFDELTLSLGFEAEMQRRTTVAPTGRWLAREYRQENRSQRFEETIGARAEGDLFGERIAHWFFDVRGGWAQEGYWERRPGPDLGDTPDGDLLEHDTRVTLLPAGKLSANLFASQLDDRIPRPFLPSLDRRRERYGVELLYNDRVLPMRLIYEDTHERLSSRSRSLHDDEQRDERALRYEATWQPSEQHQLRLSYEYSDDREQYSGTDARFDTTRNYLTLNHVLAFGADGRSRLETVARFQDETGDLARDVYEVAPQLRLQHSDTLWTTYRAQYLQESFEGATLEVARGDIGVNKQFSPAWLASANVYALNQDADQGGDTSEWGAIGSVHYSDANAWGRLTASVNLTFAQQRHDGGDADGVVIAESLTFRDPLPAYLARQDVNTLTLLVTDPTRRRTYLPGRDYLVFRIGRYTALTRVRTGRIIDGETVLVSYTYRTSEGLELSRTRVDLRVQQEFRNGLTPYYAGSIQDEDLDRTRFRTLVARDVNRHRVGVNYRKPRWSTGVEYEYNHDAIDPYQGVHLTGDATIYDRAPHTLGARGRYSYLSFDGARDLDARQTQLLDLGLTYRCLLAATLEAGAAAVYRFEHDSSFGETHGVDVSGSLNWKIGQFTALFEVEYDLLDLPGSHDGTFAAWIKLRREFPIIRRDGE